MVYSKTYCPWSKRLKAILANYEIDDMKIVELDRSNQTEEMQVGVTTELLIVLGRMAHH